jgi:hypothetical protein
VSEGSVTGNTTRRCVDALAERQDELETALAGRSLLVLVDYREGPSLRVIVTRSGYVAVVPADEPFEPNVELRGSSQDIGAFLRQQVSLADAILAGVVTIRMPESDVASYRRLRDVVADVLEAVGER